MRGLGENNCDHSEEFSDDFLIFSCDLSGWLEIPDVRSLEKEYIPN